MGMMMGVMMMNGIEVCVREWLDGGICRVRGMMVLGTRRRRCEAHSQDPVRWNPQSETVRDGKPPGGTGATNIIGNVRSGAMARQIRIWT